MRYFGAYFLGALWVLLLGAAGCGAPPPERPPIEFDWTLRPDPPREGPATLTLNLTDSSGHPVSGADVEVEGNMTHAGMQPVFAEATEADAGQYTVPLEFTMAGDWFLLIEATLPDGRSIEHTIEVPAVRPR